VKRNLSRWLIPLPALVFAFFPNSVRADPPTPGLNAVGYTINQIPPTKSDTVYQTCGREVENNINRNFNGEPFQQCPNDNFMVHYTGSITVPTNETIAFQVAADDGGTVKIGETEFGTWNLKGCSWSEQTTALFPAGTYALDGWFFEYGGNTCYMLAWNINGQGWQIVPDSAFTTQPIATTTSTTVPSTTTTATSTTTSSSSTTTTTVYIPTESEQREINAIAEVKFGDYCASIGNAHPNCPQPATTVEPPPTTSTSVPERSSVETTLPPQTAPETTTTSRPEPSTTLPAQTIQRTTTTESARQTTTTQPSIPPTSVLSSTLPSVSTTVLPVSTIASDDRLSAQPTLPKPTEEAVRAVNVQQNIETISAVIDIVAETISDPAQLDTLTPQQIEEVFEELVVEDLTEDQAAQLVAVLTEAPTKVKKAFENKVNVFSGLFNSYKMAGQTIPVEERRTLLAVSNTLVAVGASLRRRDK